MIPVSKDRPITAKGVRAFLLWSFITKRDSLVYPKFCEARDSFAKEDFAAALGTVPQLTEVGYDVPDPVFEDFTDYRIDWINRLFKLRVSVTRSLLDFDLTGQTRRILDAIAARVANWPDRLFFTRLRAGQTLESYESGRNGVGTKYYFDAAHDLGQGISQSNLLTGHTTTASIATTAPASTALLIQQDFAVAVAQLRSFVDDKSQPWHPTVLEGGRLAIICSPLLAPAMEIAFGATFVNMTDNMFRSKVEVVSTPYLPSTGAEGADWFLMYIGPNTNRPFLYSRFRRIPDERIEDYLSLTTGEGDEKRFGGITMEALQEWSAVEIQTNLSSRGTNNEADVILNDRYLFGARWMGDIVPLIWQNCILVNNAAA